jgi:predicted RND superfamily exporter protein
MHIDKVAKETTKYYSDIRGQNANTYRFKDSSYEDSLRKDDKTHFSIYKDPKTMDYLNKIYGIPSNLKLSNNENTLYYEKQLGNKTELDFATEHFDRSEVTSDMFDRQIAKHPDKVKAVNDIVESLKNRHNKRNTLSTFINEKAAEKHASRTLKISSVAPKDVTVSPAFTTKLPAAAAAAEEEGAATVSPEASPKKGDEEEIQSANVTETAHFQRIKKEYTKDTLKQHAEVHGIVLDMSQKKDDMIREFIKQMSGKSKNIPLQPLGHQV